MTDTPHQADTSDAPSVGIDEIADLLAWTRRLAEAGHHADPGERAAYQAAKADLLTRITHDHHSEGGTG